MTFASSFYTATMGQFQLLSKLKRILHLHLVLIVRIVLLYQSCYPIQEKCSMFMKIFDFSFNINVMIIFMVVVQLSMKFPFKSSNCLLIKIMFRWQCTCIDIVSLQKTTERTLYYKLNSYSHDYF